MLQYPVEFQLNATPLPESVNQAELNERGLHVMQGLNMALAEQLVSSSNEPHIAEYCPNDPTKRFGSVDRVMAWQTKGRLALPLVKSTGEGALVLAGFGWMGPGEPGDDEPTIPGAKTTFAIRIYQEAVGQGNALPYIKAILAAHDALYDSQGVWLEAWGDNLPALKTYERAGFQKVAEIPGSRHGEIVTRVYMTLGNIATR